MSEDAVEVGHDPFGKDAPGVQLIVQLQIRDLLYALLRETNPEIAESIMEMHAKGAVMGPAPQFRGSFVYDELNQNEL